MEIKLLAYTREPERLCAAAAKLCHEPDQSDFGDMMEALDQDTIDRLLRFVLRKEHLSVIEHASFTFVVTGVSRALTHQLVRHRIASYSQQSQRYVRFDSVPYVVPSSIERDGELSREYGELMDHVQRFYSSALESGRVPAEDARFALPNAMTTKIVITMNARELRHFFELRLDPTAQWEIRLMAREMLREVLPVCPGLFSDIRDKYLDGDWEFLRGVRA